MRMRYGTLVATAVVCAAVGLAVGAPEALQCVYVDGLDLSGSVCGGGRKTSSRMSVVGKPLSVAGKTYERGFGSQAEGAVGIRLDGRATLFKVARRVRHADAESVWAKPLADGSIAVALVNRYPFAREIRVTFSELGLGGERWVKDLWRQKCEGLHYGEYAAIVPPHATKLIKTKPVDCPKCD